MQLMEKGGKISLSSLFAIGFVLGILLPNLWYRMEWHQNTASALYLMGIFSKESNRDYLHQVLRMRGTLFLSGLCSGITVFGVPFAVAGMLLSGLLIGMLLSMSVLQFGLNGGLIGAGLLFPQYVIYLPCMFWGMEQIYGYSASIWKKHSMFVGQVGGYLLRMFVCGIFWLIGILLEVYCNPVITEVLIRNLKIFT
ncbi:stage II sporulation protein M [Blautia sp. MSJ-19]|uniref:stage II sporulation protein M n=1 Tax=Blautia sp. MSJ-19 TaxID=2841517 RepID=UPI001C0EF84B|nr:stage II sporulation protein M [Blautia sp. MSJ-19]MBU5480833.1 stage II sporulation protein M [Blautia sp. MSJ-19]